MRPLARKPGLPAPLRDREHAFQTTRARRSEILSPDVLCKMRRSFLIGNLRLSRELWPGSSIELNRQAEQAATTLGNLSSSRARDLGQ